MNPFFICSSIHQTSEALSQLLRCDHMGVAIQKRIDLCLTLSTQLLL